MTPVLTIIDMQRFFLEAWKYCGAKEIETQVQKWTNIVNSIRSLIKVARERHIPIIVVKYHDLNYSTDYDEVRRAIGDFDYDAVDPRIIEALDGYDYQTTVYKDDDNGAIEIEGGIEALKIDKFDVSEIVLTGVNQSGCVIRTLDGLLDRQSYKKLPRHILFSVPEGASGNMWDSQTAAESFQYHRRVRVKSLGEVNGTVFCREAIAF